MTRAVTDTNVLVSALLYGGVPGAFLSAAKRGEVAMLTSMDLLDELDETLSARKFRVPTAEIVSIRSGIESYAEIVSTHIRVQAVISDPDDDRVLECALAGSADFIVSGDRHLLSLASYEGILILTVRQFMDRFFPAS